jgi:hypothetical protein
MMAMIVCLWGLASVQLTYDVANYKALADADSPGTIPPGTTITVQNWQKYRKFMQMWKQAAYSGQYKWHVGAEPEYTVEVGPTHHFSGHPISPSTGYIGGGLSGTHGIAIDRSGHVWAANRSNSTRATA